jgi:hypothetical protein
MGRQRVEIKKAYVGGYIYIRGSKKIITVAWRLHFVLQLAPGRKIEKLGQLLSHFLSAGNRGLSRVLATNGTQFVKPAHDAGREFQSPHFGIL